MKIKVHFSVFHCNLYIYAFDFWQVSLQQCSFGVYVCCKKCILLVWSECSEKLLDHWRRQTCTRSVVAYVQLTETDDVTNELACLRYLFPKRYETRLEQCCRPISVLYSSHTSVLLQSETLLKILPDRGISSSFCFSFVFVISRVLVCAALPWANRQPNTLQKLYTWNSHFWVYVQNSPWQLAKELVRLLVQLWAVRWQQQGRIQMGRLNSSGSSSKAWTRNRLLFLSRWSACNCHCNTKTNKLAVLHSLGTFIFPGPET